MDGTDVTKNCSSHFNAILCVITCHIDVRAHKKVIFRYIIIKFLSMDITKFTRVNLIIISKTLHVFHNVVGENSDRLSFSWRVFISKTSDTVSAHDELDDSI